MKIISTIAQEIQSYIQGREPEANLFERVQLDGKISVLKVWRIPLEYLTFNIRNGRFAAELLEKEKQLKRKLNPATKQDAVIIQRLLLEQNVSETKTLKTDLMKHGQIYPGIITHDGAVINANRRLAIMRSIFDEEKDDKWGYLKVAILPETVGEKDLWRIEAGLQFGKDFRLDYGPVNELLKLREGINCGLDASEISVSLGGRYTNDEVNGRLNVLKLIDDFLTLINKPGEYQIISQRRLMEKFNSLSDNVLASLKKKEDLDAVDLAELTEAAFAMINNTSLSHWEIRKLAKIARNEVAFKAFKDALPEEPLSDESGIELENAFKTGNEWVEDHEERNKPERLIQKALSAVSNIDKTNALLKTDSVQKLLESLIDSATNLRLPITKE